MNIQSLIRPNIQVLTPYSSARDEFEGEAGTWLDANESPFNNGLNRYPDPYQKELKWAIAKEKDVMPNQVFLGNGSDEAIDLIIRAFCKPGKDKILQFSPTYGMYKVNAGINDVEVLDVPLTADFQVDLPKAQRVIEQQKPRVIFLCSPNNPTGNLADIAAVNQLLKSNAIVVIDEAYAYFSSGASWTERINAFNNLVILQTFSKARGLAAIRLGMAFGNPEIVDVLNKIKPPYNINQLTQEAALDSLKAFDQEKIDLLIEEREKLQKALNDLDQVVKVYPSEANFLLVEFKDAKSWYKKLAKNGIVVRNRTSQVPGCLRITVGTPQENERLLRVLGGDSPGQFDSRMATVRRKTTETDISITINLDDPSYSSISTGLGFYDHMLEQVAKHGKIGLNIDVKGDLQIDEHHTIEDTAIALGEAFTKALGDKRGIERYGYMLPMDDCLAQVAIDFGGRPWLECSAEFRREKVGELPTEMFYHFFKSFSDAAKCNLNIKAEGENEHHKIEAIFKAFARAIRMAVKKEGNELPSTKGKL